MENCRGLRNIKDLKRFREDEELQRFKEDKEFKEVQRKWRPAEVYLSLRINKIS